CRVRIWSCRQREGRSFALAAFVDFAYWKEGDQAGLEFDLEQKRIGVEPTQVPPLGRRARKKEETRRRIIDAAKALFLERGFTATTLDDIAEAADISKRSFFDYFPSKEGVFSAWHGAVQTMLVGIIAARPAGEPPLVAAERALLTCLARYDLEDASAHAR